MNVPKALVSQIARGNGVVFVGAGFSVASGLPTWRQLLKDLLDWSETRGVDVSDRRELENYINSGELLLVAEEMRERLGQENFRDFMTEVFLQRGQLKPSAAHLLLPRIPFSAVLTSNYDGLLESAYAMTTGTIPRVVTQVDYPELSATLRGSDFYVLKVHGTIDRITTVVFGSSDYHEVMRANPAYRQHLMTLFSVKTVLFLGFGLTDPDLLLLFDEMKATFREFTGKHYALMNTVEVPRIKQKRFEKDYGIQIIPYVPSAHDHPEVRTFLSDLMNQSLAERAQLRPSPLIKMPPANELATEVQAWLQTSRYDVTPPVRHNERSVYMTASLDQGTIKQRVLVGCFEGEIDVNDVNEARYALDVKTPQAWLISDKRVSPRAAERADKDGSVQVFSLADFLQRMIWRNYVESLTASVEESRMQELYVDLACYKVILTEAGEVAGYDQHQSLDSVIDDWLTERGRMHISLLGEFGTGKTWFCHHYAYRQLNRYLKDPAKERLPLLIRLRTFAKSMTVQQMINDTLLSQYDLPFIGNPYETFQELNRQGKLLLILDGFDEMAQKVDYQIVVDNFWELAKLVDGRSKVILTSRTEYFRWAKESEKIFGGSEFGKRTIVLDPPKFEVLYLEPFTDQQIRDVIQRRAGADADPAVADRILGRPHLAEMARKPVLIELLLASLTEISESVLEHPAQVYLYATNKLLLRNITAEKTFTSTTDKLFFLCELAWEMINSGQLRINYKDIPDRIRSYFGDQIKDKNILDTWDYDLRNQTLLHRDVYGYYEFAHKSLAEYFVAFKFAAELGCLAPMFRQAYRELGDQLSRIPFRQKDVSRLADTFGATAITDASMYTVKGLLLGMFDKDSSTRLWESIDNTRGCSPEQVKYVGGNAATLLADMDESFVGRDLAGTVLTGAYLRRLTHDRRHRFPDLAESDLSFANLQEVNLFNANLRNANLTGTIIDAGGLREADLRGVRGLERRFFPLVSAPPPESRFYFDRQDMIEEIRGYISDSQSPSVIVLAGESGAGKTTLLSNIASEVLRLEPDRNLLWVYGNQTVITPYTGYFLSELATFLTVGGYELLASYVELLRDTMERMSIYNSSQIKFMERQVFPRLLPILKKEKWLLCIDDIYLHQLKEFLTFFAREPLLTTIIATTIESTSELPDSIKVIQIHPVERLNS